jgi:hypothetical protein
MSCARVDPRALQIGQHLRDKALALQTYAKQANNVEAERRACEIRLRAERKAGALLKEMEKAKGAREPGIGKAGRNAVERNDRVSTKTLADYGLSKDQSSRWQKLADVPEDEFEQRLRGSDKPTTSGIIEAAKPNPVTPGKRLLANHLKQVTMQPTYPET